MWSRGYSFKFGLRQIARGVARVCRATWSVRYLEREIKSAMIAGSPPNHKRDVIKVSIKVR